MIKLLISIFILLNTCVAATLIDDGKYMIASYEDIISIDLLGMRDQELLDLVINSSDEIGLSSNFYLQKYNIGLYKMNATPDDDYFYIIAHWSDNGEIAIALTNSSKHIYIIGSKLNVSNIIINGQLSEL